MTSSLPAAIVTQLEQLGTALLEGVQQQRGATLATHEEQVLRAVRAALPGLLGAVVALATPALDPGIATVHRRCPSCDQVVRMHQVRSRTLTTTCGPLTLTRPWYACAACQHGFSPADQALALAPHARLSPALHAWVVTLGATTVYREAAAVLTHLTGLVVASDTIRAHTTAAGECLAAQEQDAIAQVQHTREAAEPVEAAPGMLVVETDGAMVRYQDGWHEVKIGVVGGTTGADGRLTAPSYVAAREPAEAFGGRLLAEAARRGALEIQHWQGTPVCPGLGVLRPVHVVGDGAHWIWHLAAEHFGERTEAVDFYHAAEHVWAVARAVYGGETEATRQWASATVRALRADGPAPVRAALAALTPPTAEAATLLRTERGYFATHAARMDYPTLSAQGLPIGSGAVESSASHLVQHRMKRSGQVWSECGGRALLTLRSRLASGRSLLPAA